MAIVNLKPTAKDPSRTTLPETITGPSKSTFTTLVPENKIKSLIKYVEGYPWTVNYYGQILNENNTLNHFDPGLLDLSQSYYLVEKLILQVSNPISPSYSEEEGIMKASGTSIAPLGIQPNAGDLFLAQVDSGEDALFVITSVSRLTHRKESLYEVNYSLFSYASNDPEFINSLSRRVNETYFFNPDTNYFNRDVLVKPSVMEAMDRLDRFLAESMGYYFNTFLQTHNSTILIPGLTDTLYDPLLMEFLYRTVDISTLPITRFHQHTMDKTDLTRPSILDNLINRTLPHKNVNVDKYKFCSAKSMPIKIRLGTLSYTGVEYVLYPVEPVRDHMTPYDFKETEVFYEGVTNERNYHVLDKVVTKTSNNSVAFSKQLLHELFEDGNYVVSENFYSYLEDKELGSDISFVELLMFKFMNQDAIAKEDLLEISSSWKEWSLLHQLYLLPVFWLIAKNT